MICRKIQLQGQPPQGLMISQLEHARISGFLAEYCLSHLDTELRSELQQAIIHHDDGWAAWEAQPKLETEGMKPLSFIELEVAESLQIWAASIEAAATIGPRAAWLVAKHFLYLLKAKEPLQTFATEWQSRMEEKCARWYRAWKSRHQARESLRWLQFLDLLSIWLCFRCPSQDEDKSKLPNEYHILKQTPFESKFYGSSSGLHIHPWRFDATNIDIEASAWIVPIRAYHNAEELLATRNDHVLRWRLSAE